MRALRPPPGVELGPEEEEEAVEAEFEAADSRLMMKKKTMTVSSFFWAVRDQRGRRFSSISLKKEYSKVSI